MSVLTVPAHAGTCWTCPFCPLLCDSYGVAVDTGAAGLRLTGSDCTRAAEALTRFAPAPGPQASLVDGRVGDLATAAAAAAGLLHGSRQPLFAGLGTDVAGARALHALALDSGAISDAADGAALMHGLRALQDRGAYTTTLAEVRTRADLIVCIGGSPSANLPEFFHRCGLGEGTVEARHIVMAGGVADDTAADEISALARLPGVSVEFLALQGDLFDTVALLAACVAGTAPAGSANEPLRSLAGCLHAAHYGVLAWEAARLPAQGALIVEALNRIVGTLNRSTRAATLPLGGGGGAATANQVYAWLSGLPLRTRAGPAGLEHEPLLFDTDRLLTGRSVDALLWVCSFGADAPPKMDLPHIVLGPAAMAPQFAASTAWPRVFIPVSTPGIGSSGHLFRADGMVMMPLHKVMDDGLPTVAEVARQLRTALAALRVGER